MNLIAKFLFAVVLVSFLATGTKAQEVNTGTVCDRPDEIAVAIQSDDMKGTVEYINSKIPNACIQGTFGFKRGKIESTVQGADDNLYDITHILVMGMMNDGKMQSVPWFAQWTAFKSSAILVTYKPEYDKVPDAVKSWFEAQHVKGPCDQSGMAYHKLGICGCCKNADRLMTKFVANKDQQWSYYPDPACTVKGCTLLPIPDYITHDEGIHAENPLNERMPEFEQMRREGVLFVYRGQAACFYPPEVTDE